MILTENIFLKMDLNFIDLQPSYQIEDLNLELRKIYEEIDLINKKKIKEQKDLDHKNYLISAAQENIEAIQRISSEVCVSEIIVAKKLFEDAIENCIIYFLIRKKYLYEIAGSLIEAGIDLEKFSSKSKFSFEDLSKEFLIKSESDLKNSENYKKAANLLNKYKGLERWILLSVIDTDFLLSAQANCIDCYEWIFELDIYKKSESIKYKYNRNRNLLAKKQDKDTYMFVDSGGQFTFHNCCLVLNIEPEEVRTMLRKLKEKNGEEILEAYKRFLINKRSVLSGD